MGDEPGGSMNMTLFEAAFYGLITADQYLDLVGEPRRPWPEKKDPDDYCALCQQYFSKRSNRNQHMRRFHIQALQS